MTGTGGLLFTAFIIWVFMRTLSYGKWTWNKKNKIGGSMVVLVAFAMLLLTVYETFLRQ